MKAFGQGIGYPFGWSVGANAGATDGSVVLAQAANFGGLTLASAGGFKPYDSSGNAVDLLSVEDQAGATRTWSINGSGALVANGTPDVDDGLQVTCSYDGGFVVLTVSSIANAYSVASAGELNTLMNGTLLSGKTAYCRGGAYGAIGAFGYLPSLASQAVIRPHKDNDRPVFASLIVTGGTTHGNCKFLNLDFYNPQNPDNHNFIGPQQIAINTIHPVRLSANCDSVILEGCRVYSDNTSSKSGGLLVQEQNGIELKGSNNSVINCEIYNICHGIEAGGVSNVVTGCSFYNIYSDFIRVRQATSLTLSNNNLYNIIGIGNILHQDFIQLTGDFNGVEIVGNVAWPGDYLNNVISSGRQVGGGDQTLEYVDVATNTSVTVASHAGKVLRSTVDSLTHSLPDAAASAGHTFWFSTQNSGHSCIVQASGSDTHADSLLPRTIDNTKNANSFMVYSDGVQWKTVFGLRAGMCYVTVSRSMTVANDNLRTLVVDASAGDIELTLPATGGGFTGCNVLRLDSTANTVTLNRNGSDVLNFNGSTVSSLDVTQEKSYTVTEAAGEMNAVHGTCGEIQGVYGNGGSYTFQNLTTRGNVFWCNASHGYRTESDFNSEIVENNSWMRPWVVDRTGDGNINSGDGWFDVQGGDSPGVRMKGDASAQDYSTRRIMRCITTGIFDPDDSSGTDAWNYLVTDLDISDPLVFPSVYFNGTEASDYYPTSRAQALSMALAKPSGPLDGTFVGALGTTTSNGYWDFENGQINAAAPDSDDAAVPYAWDTSWVDMNTGSGSGELDITLSSVCYANGALTDIEVEFDSSGTWESLTATGAGTYTLTKSDGVSYELTGIRGVNATGNGVETALSITRNAGTSAWTFADSEPVADYSDADWGSQAVASGWLERPGGNVRSDSSTGAFAPPTGATTLTGVVDIRLTSGGSPDVAGVRLWNVTQSIVANVTLQSAGWGVGGSGADSSGQIDMGGGVHRLWFKITAAASDRIICDYPTAGETNFDFKNPALFYGDLSVAEIGALT